VRGLAVREGVTLLEDTMKSERPPLRVLVVDDEALGRDCVRLAVESAPGFEVVGLCENGAEAVEQIAAESPDLVVLDIQMPGKSGFEVIREVGVERMPATVFVTAHDDFALQAFEVHALDYVLKPFDDGRLHAALEYARDRLANRDGGIEERLRGLLASVAAPGDRPPGTAYAKRLLVRTGDRFRYLPIQEIDYIEAAGNNLKVHTRTAAYLIRMTVNEIVSHLDPTAFVRIHRSTVVRIGALKEIQPWFGGDYIAILEDSRQLRVSRTYRDRALRPFL
jgi:two-component system LytT family response regulator